MDEGMHISTSRVGMWWFVMLTTFTIIIDIVFTLLRIPNIPNVIYGVEGTGITMFGCAVLGPRVAEYFGPQVGQIIQGITSSVRSREPDNKRDDERGIYIEREEV